MNRQFHILMGTVAVAVALATPSLGEDMSAGKMPAEAGSSRAVGAIEFEGRAAKAMPGISADRSASRALDLDATAVEKAFTLVGRSKDGKVTRMAPGDEVIKAIQGDATPAGEKRTMNDTGEPDEAGGEEQRAVVGDDNRLAIRNSTTYPFTTAGFLEITNAKGESFSCSAAVIGRNTVLTAGHCLYDHKQAGGWFEKYTFWPAINGQNTVPFGGYAYDTVYVFGGYISDFDGSYDTIWPYDIGMVTFADPVGDSTGWLGYEYDPNLGDFRGNLVGYHNDKAAFSLWRSACDVTTENIRQIDFVHDCDAAGGSSGAPIYVYDKADQSRTIVGVNIGDAAEGNWALRLYPAIFEWIQAVNK
jgi:V8-like Glu-specific endopeptidase